MVPAPYGYCFKLFDFFRSCKILFGLVKFKTAPDRMSGNVWEVFVNTVVMILKMGDLAAADHAVITGMRDKPY